MENKIEITDNAQNYIANIINKDNAKYFRITVLGGGCAGFSYQWSFTDGPKQHDEVINIADKSHLVLDSMSLLYLMNMNIDYKIDIAGAILQLENPNVTSSCGCGESFNVV